MNSQSSPFVAVPDSVYDHQYTSPERSPVQRIENQTKSFSIKDNSTSHSRSSSIWTAPSPSQRIERTPLHATAIRHSERDSWTTPPIVSSHHKSTHSAYYTAPWGSPHEYRGSIGAHPHKQAIALATPVRSGDQLAASVKSFRPPISSLDGVEQNDTPISTKAAINDNQGNILASPASDQRLRRYGFTKEWLSNNTWRRGGLEQQNRSRKVSVSSGSGASDNFQEAAQDSTRPEYTKSAPLDVLSTDNSSTVPPALGYIQEEGSPILSALRSPGSKMASSNTLSSDGNVSKEKPLPPPPLPFDRTVSEMPMPESAIREHSVSPRLQRHRSQSSVSGLRPRKRLVWRGKVCWIALPTNDKALKGGEAQKPLSRAEVAERLQSWEAQGYNIAGFQLCTDPGQSQDYSHSRSVFPSLEDIRQERSKGSFSVRIPDRAEWEAYVERLKEDKLRALGVTSVSEDVIARRSPIPNIMSRDASSQSSAFPISPSLALHTEGGVNGFEVAPSGNSYPVSRISSAGPPLVSVPSKPSVAHFPRYSMAMPNGGLQQPIQLPKSVSPHAGIPAAQAPHMLQSHSRGVSPHVDPRMQSLGAAVNAGIPPAMVPQQQNQQARNLLAAMQAQQAQIQMQHLQQQQLFMHRQPSSQTSMTSEHSNQMQEIRSQPELATPIPRGHRQNLSETLHREAEQVESRQQQNGEYRGNAIHPEDHPHLSEDLTTDSVNKQSGLHAPSDRGNDAISQVEDFEPQDKRHTSTSSTSRLNVNAPEFKFGTSKTKSSGASDFLEKRTVALPVGSQSTETSTIMNSTAPKPAGLSQGLNVKAPTFVPSTVQKPGVPSREFSFSSSGPKFKPDAPAFKPQLPSGDSGIAAEKSIFGKIDFDQVVKPLKKSRAVPIIHPEGDLSEMEDDVDGIEDELGRITQPEGRQKRARRGNGDGDQVPLFAVAQDLDRTVEHRNSQQSVASIVDEDLLNLPIVESANHTGATKDVGEPDIPPLTPMSRHEGEQPFAFDTPEDAAMFSAAHPRSPSLKPRQGSTPPPAEIAQPESHENSDGAAAMNASLRDIADVSLSMPAEVLIEEATDVLASTIDGVTYIEPSYNEIDAVMKQLDGDDYEIGIERHYRPSKPATSSATVTENNTPVLSPPRPFSKRSGAPSPSPRRGEQQRRSGVPLSDSESADTADMETAYVAANARFSPSYRPSMTDLAKEALVHKLNSPDNASISDWDDAISSSEELKFQTRTGFFARHVDDLVGNIVQERLDPLEKSLAGIQGHLAEISNKPDRRPPRRSTSTGDIEMSDADDEDDQADSASQSKPRSPLRSRKYDNLRSSVLEISSAQQNVGPALAEVISIVQDLKRTIDESPLAATDIKSIVEDAVARQMRGRSQPVTSSQQSASAEKNQLQIAGLETMLKVAENRAEDEMKARRSTEDALADNQRLLRSAMHEAAEHREASEETERSLEHLHEERHEMLRRNAVLEGSNESLEGTVTSLTDKIEALESTLEEYRLSGTKWRGEIEETKAENNTMRKTIDVLREEMEESVAGRESIKLKFERLQDDMAATSREIATEQSTWRSKEVEYETKHELLGARLEAEARTRERLEREIERLESQEIESMKARFLVEQTQKANTDLEAQMVHYRGKCEEHLDQATNYARELKEAQDIKKAELTRMQHVMEAQLRSAESKVKDLVAEHESANTRLQAQLQHVTSEADISKARYEVLLKETTDRSRSILQEALEAKNVSTQEQISSFERSHRQLKDQHEKDLANSVEDKRRVETHFTERLHLADEKNRHYTDRIAHLEEMLSIAQSAAQAAAKATRHQSRQKPDKADLSPNSSPSLSTRGISSIPEKISPQALRESILVLQEQLQQRESRIENLEHSLSEVDTEAPKRVKEQEVEISWLRELLGVRLDDLQDIINILSEPDFDPDAVRDAVIRLKANLQMEQQEKERAAAGGLQAALPTSLSNITSLAASPRALPMAAAAAWGNWRKASSGSTSGPAIRPFGSLSAVANGSASASPRNRTPSSKPIAQPPSSSQSFLSGLLTPPNTTTTTFGRNTTRTFSNGSVRRPGSASSTSSVIKQQQSTIPRTPRQSISKGSPYSDREPPMTPTLMRNSSYDQDAESTDMGALDRRAGGEDDDDGGAGLFGPRIGQPGEE